MKLLSSLAVKAAYVELVPRFEQASGARVRTEWVGMADIRKRMHAGEEADVVIGSAALVDELIRSERLMAGSRVDLASSGVGVAVRQGAPRPDIGSVEALKRAMRGARSIVYSSGPSGVYLAELFKRWGLAAELEGKLTQAPPGVFVGELVARGEMELAFQQVPELRQVPGIDFLGALPQEIQLLTVFSGGVHARTADAEAAQALLQFLCAPSAAAVWTKTGMAPASL